MGRAPHLGQTRRPHRLRPFRATRCARSSSTRQQPSRGRHGSHYHRRRAVQPLPSDCAGGGSARARLRSVPAHSQTVRRPRQPVGNHLLHRLCGPTLRFITPEQYRSRNRSDDGSCRGARQQGTTAWLIPEGASDYLGMLGFAAAGAELADQIRSWSSASAGVARLVIGRHHRWPRARQRQRRTTGSRLSGPRLGTLWRSSMNGWRYLA